VKTAKLPHHIFRQHPCFASVQQHIRVGRRHCDRCVSAYKPEHDWALSMPSSLSSHSTGIILHCQKSSPSYDLTHMAINETYLQKSHSLSLGLAHLWWDEGRWCCSWLTCYKVFTMLIWDLLNLHWPWLYTCKVWVAEEQ
jgi:hypothetical protein